MMGSVERHDRRITTLRRACRVGLIVAAVFGLVLPVAAGAEDVPGVALDRLERTFTLEERGCGDTATPEPSCSSRATELGRRPGWRVRTFDQVTATLPSHLRDDCDVGVDDIGWPTTWIRCFDGTDTKQSQWLTQGITGTDEWRTPETPGGDAHFLVATWCWRGSEGVDEWDVCDAEEPVKRTRISIISVEDNRYRNVELVEPYREQPAGSGGPVVSARGVLLHAGGAALAGPWLYVADTDWIYFFNLDHFVQEGTGPYQLPVWARYIIADADDRDEHNPFSSISIDGSGRSPRLVAAEYRLGRADAALVTVWPLETDGRLPPADPRISSTQAYTIDGGSRIDNVQGVAAAGDIFLFSESANTIERTPAGVPRREEDQCIEWGTGTGEDLYASRPGDLLASTKDS